MKPALNLTIRRQWLDMIASGQKREEYRDPFNRQVARLWKSWFRNPPVFPPVAIFRAGYRMDSPAIACRLDGINIRAGSLHPEWGEPRRPAHFVLAIRFLRSGPYAEIKAFCQALAKTEGEDA